MNAKWSNGKPISECDAEHWKRRARLNRKRRHREKKKAVVGMDAIFNRVMERMMGQHDF